MNTYETTRIAIDAVLFTIINGSLHVYLREREKEPFQGKFELLGGLLQPKETAEQTLSRKLQETIGKKETYFTQFFTFTDPDRDPRTRTVSIGYMALVSTAVIDDDTRWYAVEALPDLAFDHKEIVRKARSFLQESADDLIARELLPQRFTLTHLQQVVETISGESLDVRNFRKQILAKGILQETDDVENNVTHRPARLYMFK